MACFSMATSASDSVPADRSAARKDRDLAEKGLKAPTKYAAEANGTEAHQTE